MTLTPRSPLTATGVLLQGLGGRPQASGPAFVPSPSCPFSLTPQALTEPLLSRARLWLAPAEMALTSLSPLTATPTLLFVVVPLPSWPKAFSPQAMTEPLLSRARLNSELGPAAMATTPLSPLTGTGTVLLSF